MARRIRTLTTRFSMTVCTALMAALFEAPVAAVAQYLDELQGYTGNLDDRLRPDYVVSDEPASADARAHSLRER
jgi:hypothetical protein